MTGWLGSQNIQHLSVKFTALYGCVLWCSPPISTLSEEQACSLSLHSAARNVGPEGECHLSVLWADYSGEELGEGK